MPISEIADWLGRASSAKYREIKRNFWADGAFPKKYAGYFEHAAQMRSRCLERAFVCGPSQQQSAEVDLSHSNKWTLPKVVYSVKPQRV